MNVKKQLNQHEYVKIPHIFLQKTYIWLVSHGNYDRKMTVNKITTCKI